MTGAAMKDGAEDLAPAYAGAALARLTAASEALTGVFAEAGFAPIETPILQPAEPLFQLYGEEIWERALVVEAPEAGALCLRPDFTAPVARAYLAAGGAEAGPTRLRYHGPVFRRAIENSATPLQHLQTGVELIGRRAQEAATTKRRRTPKSSC